MSAAPQISSPRVDGQWAWELDIHIYSSVALHIYPKAIARGVRFRRTWVCAGCAARSHDGRRPPQHRHIPALERPMRRAILPL